MSPRDSSDLPRDLAPDLTRDLARDLPRAGDVPPTAVPPPTAEAGSDPAGAPDAEPARLDADAGPGARPEAPTVADAAGGPGARGKPVLSLEERKAERLRARGIEAGGQAAQGAGAQGAGVTDAAGAARAAGPGDAPPALRVLPPAAGPAPVGPAPAGLAPIGPAVRPPPGPGPRGPGQGPGQAPGQPPGRAPAPAADAAPTVVRVAAPAPRAKPRPRHWGLLLSFVLLVLAPTGVVAWYLWERAADRYESVLGFSVRTEDVTSPMEMLSGLGLGGSASGSDTDILYRFVQSQEIVAAVDRRLDLRALWSKADPARDPVYAFHPPGTIEDLTDYWNRMVRVYNDRGLIDVEVQAFAPEDAQAVAQAIWTESQDLINRLSAIALDDATRGAEQELALAVDRLKAAREAVTRFRNLNQMVDPTSFIASQTGLLASLESQLAQTLIELDLLRQGGAGDADPRVEQTLARVGVIQSRMDEERAKVGGADDTTGTTSADIVGEYERLMVDQEFAQQAYVAAMAAYDGALAEGRRQSRYLAAHVQPTLAERADHPARVTLTLLTALFAALIWIVLALTAYALRDRR